MESKDVRRVRVGAVDVPVDVARDVLAYFGDDRQPDPGMFVTRLLMTFSAADRVNRSLLCMSYPDYMEAFELVSQVHGGFERLRAAVRGVEDDAANQLPVFDGGQVAP